MDRRHVADRELTIAFTAYHNHFDCRVRTSPK